MDKTTVYLHLQLVSSGTPVIWHVTNIKLEDWQETIWKTEWSEPKYQSTKISWMCFAPQLLNPTFFNIETQLYLLFDHLRWISNYNAGVQLKNV